MQITPIKIFKAIFHSSSVLTMDANRPLQHNITSVLLIIHKFSPLFHKDPLCSALNSSIEYTRKKKVWMPQPAAIVWIIILLPKRRCGNVGMIKEGKTGLQRKRDPANHRVGDCDENRLLWEAKEVSGEERRFEQACGPVRFLGRRVAGRNI